MEVQLNTSRLATSGNVSPLAATETSAITQSQEASVILSAQSVKITEAVKDLEALLAHLRMETNDAREDAVLSVLSNAYVTVESVNAKAAQADKSGLDEIGALVIQNQSLGERAAELKGKIVDTQATIDGQKSSIALLENSITDLEATLKDLNKEIKAVETEIAEVNDALEALAEDATPEGTAKREELETKKATLEASYENLKATIHQTEKEAMTLKGQIVEINLASQTAKVELNRLNFELKGIETVMASNSKRIDTLTQNLSDESYRALIDAVIANIEELSHLVEPLEEKETPVVKALSDMTISELLQYVKERREEMLDMIDSKRQVNV